VVERLINSGCDIRLKNDQGFTSLHLAARRGSLECVKLLVEADASIFEAKAYKHFYEVVQLASKSESNYDIMQLMISKLKKDPRELDVNDRNDLHCAIEEGNLEMVEYFLDLFPQYVDKPNDNGWSPLHLAISQNVKTLLLKGWSRLVRI